MLQPNRCVPLLFLALGLTSAAPAQWGDPARSASDAAPMAPVRPTPSPLLTRGLDGNPHPQFDIGETLRALSGVQMLDGAPLAFGPNYKARFSAEGLLFTPQVPIDRVGKELSFRFQGAAVGGVALTDLDLDAEPYLNGDTVEFDRGRGVREVYEPLREGLEQFFVFDELPTRSGDLVVHGRLTSDFELPADTGPVSRIDLGNEVDGGMTITKAIGIDAAGREVPVDMRLRGDLFDLTLPESFVQTAELPLVIDPIFGSLTLASPHWWVEACTKPTIAGGGAASLAYAFSRRWSSTDSDIEHLEYSYDSPGVLYNHKFISISSLYSSHPSIAYNRLANAFMIAWSQGLPETTNIRLRTVRTDETVSSFQDVPNLSPFKGHPQVASEPSGVDDEVLLVWAEEDSIRGAQVRINPFDPPSIFPPITFETASDNSLSNPHISESGGPLLKYMVTWERQFSPDKDLRFRLVSKDMNPLSPTQFMTTIGPDERNPRVDGDGETFLLVYELTGADTQVSRDIQAKRILMNPSGSAVLSIDTVDIEVDFGQDRNPAVGCTGESFYVAWEDSYNGVGYDIALVRLDSDGLEIVEGKQLAVTGGDTAVFIDFATSYSGGGQGPPRADLVLQRKFAITDEYAGYWVQLGHENNSVELLASGCGNGGSFFSEGSYAVGNKKLTARLFAADPTATEAFLWIRFDPQSFDCGLCSILIPEIGFTTTMSNGFATVPLPLPSDPNLAGVELFMQWVVLGGSSTGCIDIPGVSFSNQVKAPIHN